MFKRYDRNKKERNHINNKISSISSSEFNTLCKSGHVVHFSIVDISYTAVLPNYFTDDGEKKIVSREIIVTSNGLSAFSQAKKSIFVSSKTKGTKHEI